jgi:virginiamycin B lyase
MRLRVFLVAGIAVTLTLTATLCVAAVARARPDSRVFRTWPVDRFGEVSPELSIVTGPDGALWFTATKVIRSDDGSEDRTESRIGRISTRGRVTQFAIPGAPLGGVGAPTVRAITSGPDDALWFTVGHRIGRITTAGEMTQYDLPSSGAFGEGITTGPDGALWFVERFKDRRQAIGRISSDGAIREFQVGRGPQGGGQYLVSITRGPDGALWFSGPSARIRRITASGELSGFALRGFASRSCRRHHGCWPTSITNGPHRRLWFVAANGSKIASMTTDGKLRVLFRAPGASQGVRAISRGPDNAMWFAHANYLGRVSPTGRIKRRRIPSDLNFILPAAITLGPDHALWLATFFTIARVSAAIAQQPSIPRGGRR